MRPPEKKEPVPTDATQPPEAPKAKNAGGEPAAGLPVAPEQVKAPAKPKKGLLQRLRLKKKGKEETLDEELRTIYADDSGKLPNLKSLDRAPSNRTRTILIGLVAFFGLLAAAAWAGFFLFQPGGFEGQRVRVAVTSAEPFVAGAPATVKVRYTNGERVTLGSLEMTVTLPSGFRMTSAEPAATEGGRWVLGTLGSGQSGEITIRGDVVAGVGESLAFSAYATYIPGNFNSEFQAVGALQSPVNDAVLRLAVSGPDRVPAGEPTSYVVRYQNQGEQPFVGGAVELVLPPDYLPEAITPAPRDEDKRVVLPDLAPGAEGEITLTGAFASEASGPRTIGAVGGLLAENRFARYATASSTTEVVGGALVLTTVTNGIVSGGRVAFGNMLRTTLTYENRGTVDVSNVELSLVYEPRPSGALLRFDTLVDENNGTRSGNTITWTKREIPRLAKLAPGDEGSIDVQLQLTDAPFTLSDRNYGVDISAEAKVAKIGDLASGRIVKSAKNVLSLNSDVACTIEARYFNDDEIAVGSGPVPPKVGSPTTYRIFWSIKNTLHELTNLAIRFPLAAHVRYGERVQASAGETRYSSSSSTVTWTLNRLPQGVTTANGEFDLIFEPSEDDAGKVVPLTGALSCESMDAAAGGVIVQGVEPLTTNLDGDPQAEGRGTVQPAQ